MSLNKKILAGAVLAGLAFSANVSAIELGAEDSVVFASELDAGTLLNTAIDDVSFDIGYNFSNGEVRYGRYECSDNMTMDNVVLVETGGNVALGAINGEGSSALFFSMTGNGVASEGDTITVQSDNTLEDGGDVNCTFSIYDQPSQAQAGGATGQIHTTGADTVITRESGFVFESNPGYPQLATADVEHPDGAYFGFESGPVFGNFQLLPVDDVLKADGTQITIADIFSSDMSVTVSGDFSAGLISAYDYVESAYVGPNVYDGDSATFFASSLFPRFDADVELDVTGEDAIPESQYFATLDAETNPGYSAEDAGPIFIGEIVRNGTQLQAPLVQVPGEWISRMVLTNTGSVDRAYEISVMGESGNVIGTDSTLLVGLVPANGTKVIELNDILLSFSGKRRATLNVTVSAPDDSIQGLYQIVSPDGALSNVIMVRPGTN